MARQRNGETARRCNGRTSVPIGMTLKMSDNRGRSNHRSNSERAAMAPGERLFSMICMGASPISWPPRFCAGTTRPNRSCRERPN
jgi:hypothetical protein